MSLDGGDVLNFRNVDGCLIVERHVRTQEVVMGDNERCKSNSAVIGLKATAWADVEFECSVEPFNELFKWPKERGFFVEILKSNDLTVFNAREFLRPLSV